MEVTMFFDSIKKKMIIKLYTINVKDLCTVTSSSLNIQIYVYNTDKFLYYVVKHLPLIIRVIILFYVKTLIVKVPY